jgi:hypothetical protein
MPRTTGMAGQSWNAATFLLAQRALQGGERWTG